MLAFPLLYLSHLENIPISSFLQIILNQYTDLRHSVKFDSSFLIPLFHIVIRNHSLPSFDILCPVPVRILHAKQSSQYLNVVTLLWQLPLYDNAKYKTH